MTRQAKPQRCIRRFSAAAIAAAIVFSCGISSLANDDLDQVYIMSIQDEDLYVDPTEDAATSVSNVCDTISVPDISELEPFEELGSAPENIVIDGTEAENAEVFATCGEAEESADLYDAVEKKLALTTFVKKKKYRTSQAFVKKHSGVAAYDFNGNKLSSADTVCKVMFYSNDMRTIYIKPQSPGILLIGLGNTSNNYFEILYVTIEKPVMTKTAETSILGSFMVPGSILGNCNYALPGKYKSSNKKVISVDSKGEANVIRHGKAKITACYGKKKLTCTVTVNVPGIDESKASVKKGKTKALTLLNQANAKGTITWKSDHPEYVSVSNSGEVTGIKKGKKATISLLVGGTVYDTCKVKVK